MSFLGSGVSKRQEKFEKAKSWFDLSKYEPQRQFSRREWGRQIAKRAQYRSAVDELTRLPESYYKAIAVESLAEMVDDLTSNPLSDWPRIRGQNPVEPVTLRYVHKLQDVVANHNQIAQVIGREPLEDVEQPLDDLMRLEGNPLGHLRINLFARDADILRAVEEWLALRRASFASELSGKSIRATSEIEWINSGLLPFTDLKIWEKFTGNDLTERNRVDLIFPEWEGGYRNKHEVSKKAFDTYLNSANAMSLIFGVDD